MFLHPNSKINRETDEKEFPVRGHSHVDYTIRACRAEANDLQYLYDFRDSNKFIGMVMRMATKGPIGPYPFSREKYPPAPSLWLDGSKFY